MPNRLIISIQPELEISLLFESKIPGLQMKLKPVEMDFTYKESYDEPVPEAYETLLLDVLEGDATLFMRSDQVEAAWQVIEPVLESWATNPSLNFPNYPANTWGPEITEALIARDGFHWLTLPREKDKQDVNKKS